MTTISSDNNNAKAKLLIDNGWDKGLVLFGYLASESVVKVSTALYLLCQQDNFPYEEEDIVFVTLTFDGKPLTTTNNGHKTMGVSSPEWKILSDGKAYMPGLCIEGTLYMESGPIVKMLAEQYPDPNLSEEERKEVMKWIDFNINNCDRLVQAEKHWGFSVLHGTNPNYTEFGQGKQDFEWEKETVKHVDDFLKTLDRHFDGNNDKKYYVGNRLTLADCVLLNWPWSFYYGTHLKVNTRYPDLWAHAQALKKTKPRGAEDHYSIIPYICYVVSLLSMRQRGFFSYGHHIENPKYWSDPSS